MTSSAPVDSGMAEMAGMSGMSRVGHAHHDHTMVIASSPGLLDDLSWRMLLAHALGALLTGFVWWVRDRVVTGVPSYFSTSKLVSPGSPGVDGRRTSRSR